MKAESACASPLMRERLFVEYDGALVGVISQTDIVGAVATAKV